MTLAELKQLALHAAKGTAPSNFTTENVNDAFVDGLKELAGSVNQFMKNRYDIYDIVIETADEVMPKKVIDTLGAFAEIKVVPQGQKAIFKRKLGRMRAKQFLTQVGLSGVYETFRLDNETFELGGHAVGGGATVDFERVLDGAESLAEVMDVITEGLTDAVFYEVTKAIKAATTNMKATNLHSANTFKPDEMLKLINTVRVYGDPVIFATPAFVATMGPDAIVPAKGSVGGVYHPQDIDAIHNTGYITMFRGVPIVQMPQSFIDENNDKFWIDDSWAYIFPGGKEKVVKVVLEGNTQINDFKNRDNSLEVYAYKKMGAAVITNHNWAAYENTSLSDAYNPYGF